jgi:hypothetical protein
VQSFGFVGKRSPKFGGHFVPSFPPSKLKFDGDQISSIFRQTHIQSQMLHGAGIFNYLKNWVIFRANVGKYSIHGASENIDGCIMLYIP